jgi:hypothetical protein
MKIGNSYARRQAPILAFEGFTGSEPESEERGEKPAILPPPS